MPARAPMAMACIFVDLVHVQRKMISGHVAEGVNEIWNAIAELPRGNEVWRR